MCLYAYKLTFDLDTSRTLPKVLALISEFLFGQELGLEPGLDNNKGDSDLHDIGRLGHQGDVV